MGKDPESGAGNSARDLSPWRSVVWDLDSRLLDVLTGLGVPFERVEVGAYLLELPPRTGVWLLAGEQDVAVEGFVLHLIGTGESEAADWSAVHRHLLRRNLGLREVHYALDPVGDIFLVGSVPHASITEHGLDTVLGEILALLTQDVPNLLRLAYGDRLDADVVLQAKVLSDGAGRRPEGTPASSPRRDARR